MNEHIEEFKRFAAAYFRWSHFNMDRIVADIIKRDKEAEDKRKEDTRLATLREQMKILLDKSNLYFDKVAAEEAKAFDFYRDVQWGTMKLKPGTVLSINRIS